MKRTKDWTLLRWALAAVLALTFFSAASPAQNQKPGGNHCDESPGQARKHGCYGGAGSGHDRAPRSRHNSNHDRMNMRPAGPRGRARGRH